MPHEKSASATQHVGLVQSYDYLDGGLSEIFWQKSSSTSMASYESNEEDIKLPLHLA
jgi:hypothetical protein